MNTAKIVQAYEQAPWRNQLQLIGLFSLAVVMIGLVAGVYLSVTARAAAMGREIQRMQTDAHNMRQMNADLQTQLARSTTTSVMEKRARDLDFKPVPTDKLAYVIIPGYVGRHSVVLAPPPGPVMAPNSALPAEFTQSLIDWIKGMISQAPLFLAGFAP